MGITTSRIDIPALTRSIREAGRLTQERLARELDVSFATVNGWERGRHRPIPSLERRLIEIADKLGLDVPEMSGDVDAEGGGHG